MSSYRIGTRTIDLSSGAIEGLGELAQRELALLRYFIENPDRAISPEELLSEVWGFAKGVRTRAVYTAIYRLRSLIEEDPDSPKIILSERGNGYRFSPPAASRSSRFPMPLDELVGRESLMKRLAELSQTARIVTLVGGPGMGKTRIAQQHGAQILNSGGIARWISSVQMVSLVGAVASAFGVALGESKPDSVDVLCQTLATHPRACLVIDDIDATPAAERRQIVEVLSALPWLSVIATGRSALDVAGEQILEVPPLDHEASLALLSRQCGASHEIGAERLGALAERVEGIPLALELVASLLRLVGPDDALQLLSRSLEPLALALDGRPGLHEAIGRSWAALRAEEREQMVALTAFRGFDVASICGVMGDSALATLTSLRRRSLLHASGSRLAMLRAVREHVSASVPRERLQAARLAHAAWFAARCARCEPIGADIANLREAVDTLEESGQRSLACLVLAFLCDQRSQSADLEELIADARRGAALAPDQETLVSFEARLSRYQRMTGRFGEALRVARRAVRLSTGEPPAVRCEALRHHLRCCIAAGLQEEAERAGEALREAALSLPEEVALGAELDAARALATSRDPAEALRRIEALHERLSAQSRPLRRHADVVAAFARLRLDPVRAERDLERLEREHRAEGHIANADGLALTRAHLLLRRGDGPSAWAILDASPGGTPFTCMMRAWCCWLSGDSASCQRWLDEAHSLSSAAEDTYAESLSSAALGVLLAHRGDLPGAIASLERARELHGGHAESIGGWIAFVLAQHGPTALPERREGEPAGVVCARVVWGEDRTIPLPKLPPEHELVDRLGVDLAARSLLRIADFERL